MLTTKYLLSQMLVNPSQLQDNCLFYTGRLDTATPRRLSEAAQEVACAKGVSLSLSHSSQLAPSGGVLVSNAC
jgi:hypothetical protein